MKSLILLLGLVIFVAVLYQTVFTPVIKTQGQPPVSPKLAPALETLKQAQELKQTLNSQSSEMDYKERITNQ